MIAAMNLRENTTSSLLMRDMGILARSDNYLSMQFRKIDKYIGKRVLEIGSGIGNHTKNIIGKKPEILIALEKEVSFCQFLKNNFGDDIELLNCDLDTISQYADSLTKKRIDTVIALNVIEHINQDLACLKILSEIIVHNGRIILIVPASKVLFSRLDKAYGHYRRYTQETFIEYAKVLNLELIENTYFNMIGWFGWLIFAKIGKAIRISYKGMSMFDRFLPILSFLEDKIHKPPFGLSLLAVFGKRGM
ncbi:MAG: class I SAM-dependent methyltransferase [Nitrospirae bacterium]|nr:class I SAM-dependent methyltransferase [Nitrospirota bacterium]